MPLELAVLKCSTKVNGEQSVMIAGILMMLELYVVNLDTKMLSSHFKEGLFRLGVERYGWMRSGV